MEYAVTAWQEQIPAGLTHKEVADVCVDAAGRVFLYARYDHAVLAYDRDGAFLRSWGKEIFGRSHGITAGSDGAIYCVDDGAHAVRKFSPDGELLLTLGTPNEPAQTGYDGKDSQTIRCSAGPFNRCTSLGVAPNGDLYVADGYGNARVHHFSARGELLRSWGEPGRGPGQFRIPHGIYVLRDGRVLVADRENHRIQFFDPEGTYLEEWTDLQRPCAIDVDAQGRIYVAELLFGDRSGRVSVFEPSGRLMARWGEYGTEAGKFIAPHGIAVDAAGDVYVAEVCWTLAGRQGKVPPDCHQIQRFTRVEAVRPAGAKGAV
jgi:DNA-binding beta-propeller fold protein YncE